MTRHSEDARLVGLGVRSGTDASSGKPRMFLQWIMFLRDKRRARSVIVSDRPTPLQYATAGQMPWIFLGTDGQTGRQPIQNGRRHQNWGQQWAFEFTAQYTYTTLNCLANASQTTLQIITAHAITLCHDSRQAFQNCFWTFVRPRPGKIFFFFLLSFFIRRGPGPNKFTCKYLSNFFKFTP